MKALKPQSKENHRTSLRLPETIGTKISDSMKAGNYGIRQRSKWICESVWQLRELENYCELIAEVFMDQKDNEQIPLTIDSGTYNLLKEISEKYTVEHDVDTIDKSVLLRAAIIQRLVTEGGGLVDLG